MVSNHTNNRRSQVSTHALAGTTEGSAFMLHAWVPSAALPCTPCRYLVIEPFRFGCMPIGASEIAITGQQGCLLERASIKGGAIFRRLVGRHQMGEQLN